ncbi:RDD family protein [Phyllobacterium leguminum]|uniref:Putative RDD family membrane protein YckC n=1 Tax=Phyllobacterium leguminum TaxID=314237 RepID=A0A318SYN2_9HYPH|nr:RDD family protein [Phyllobacterium leguminum]PYE87190.1 putative RDD family membrane protein YckC [Phyllobacterium leguminum]
MTDNVLHGEIIPSQRDDWRLYQGVRTRRIFAFLIDYLLVLLLCIPVAVVIAVLGVATLGLGWMLYGIMFPLVALGYVATTLGGRRQATKGMQMMDIKLERLDGRPVDGMLAMVHTVLFWAGNVILTPLILLATLFLDRKRTVHDMLLGTVVVRADR